MREQTKRNTNGKEMTAITEKMKREENNQRVEDAKRWIFEIRKLPDH